MNTKQLRDHLVKEMKLLRDGKTTVDKAMATSRIASVICRTKELEVRVADFRKMNNGEEECPVGL